MRIAVAALVAACFLAPAALAQPHPGHGNVFNQGALNHAQVQRATVTHQRYIVLGLRFHANDETGPDWPGSDEVYARYDDLNSGQSRFTSTYEDIDTGDTQTFKGTELCIGPLPVAPLDSHGFPPKTWACQGPGLTTVRFNVHLYEADGWSPMACARAPNVMPSKKNCDDDDIGSAHIDFSASALLAMMPHVNDIHEQTLTMGGYTFTYRIQRVSDTQDPG